MEKDKRYRAVNKLISSGHITSLSDIIDVIPKTVLARDIGMHHVTFAKLLEDPSNFTFGMTKKIAALAEVEHIDVTKIIFNSLGNKYALNIETAPKKAKKKGKKQK